MIAVRDMEQARAAYERLGFTVPPRGSHLEWGTGNWCIMFERDYLELRGIIDPTRYTHGLDTFLAEREGLMGVALALDDAEAMHAALVAHGWRLAPLRRLTRNFELPEGAVPLRFALCLLDPRDTPGLMSVVLCQHLTPELLRRPTWLRHANTACGVRSLACVVEDLGQTEVAYSRLFGRSRVRRDPALLRVEFPGGQEIVAIPAERAAEVYPELAQPRAEQLASVSLDASDLNATRGCLERHGVAFHETARGSLLVSPEETCGVLLEFLQPEHRGAFD